jgi:hypothetical protein
MSGREDIKMPRKASRSCRIEAVSDFNSSAKSIEQATLSTETARIAKTTMYIILLGELFI